MFHMHRINLVLAKRCAWFQTPSLCILVVAIIKKMIDIPTSQTLNSVTILHKYLLSSFNIWVCKHKRKQLTFLTLSEIQCNNICFLKLMAVVIVRHWDHVSNEHLSTTVPTYNSKMYWMINCQRSRCYFGFWTVVMSFSICESKNLRRKIEEWKQH